MPKKVRERRKRLREAEFNQRPGKGSHQVWKHSLLPTCRIVISKSDGEDAPPWLEKQIMAALKQLEELRNSEETEE